MDSADGDNVYLVTVTASDGSASKSQAVSITVTNREEAGTITLSQLVPQEGIAITARLSDQDGNITGTEWQWYRGHRHLLRQTPPHPKATATGTQTVSTLRVDEMGLPDNSNGHRISAVTLRKRYTAAVDQLVFHC